WATQPPEFGGVGWHGAALGAMVVLWAGWWRYGERWYALVGGLAPVVPLLAFSTWTACRRTGCAFGKEVGTLAFYPAWLVTEGRDVYGLLAPRYDTQAFGQSVALMLLVIVALLWLRGRGGAWLTWSGLMTVAATTFVIEFVMGGAAPTVMGLRVTQLMDVGIFVMAGISLLMSVRSVRPAQ
ncbi:MAG: prolipoprotein diacylglyceryl transferase family protein, partial [Chloroflexota bacterium]